MEIADLWNRKNRSKMWGSRNLSQRGGKSPWANVSCYMCALLTGQVV